VTAARVMSRTIRSAVRAVKGAPVTEVPSLRRNGGGVVRAGDWAWLVLFSGVAAYEAFSPPGELMSEAADRARATHPILTDLAIVYVAAHLLRRWPSRVDPLTQLASRLRR
jgi:hypothetical protein